jgi:hypothetical protein
MSRINLCQSLFREESWKDFVLNMCCQYGASDISDSELEKATNQLVEIVTTLLPEWAMLDGAYVTLPEHCKLDIGDLRESIINEWR